jgi:hypothetical protein
VNVSKAANAPIPTRPKITPPPQHAKREKQLGKMPTRPAQADLEHFTWTTLMLKMSMEKVTETSDDEATKNIKANHVMNTQRWLNGIKVRKKAS